MAYRFPSTVLYLILAVLVVVTMLTLDVPVSTWVHNSNFPSWFKSILSVVRWPGIYWFTLIFAGAFMIRFRWSWNDTFALLLAGAIASGMTAMLKVGCGRIRPFRGNGPFDWTPFAQTLDGALVTGNLSFPSGDTTLAFATACVFAHLMPRWKGYGYAWAVAVGVTRVLQGAHYPSDTVAASIVGLLTAETVIRTLKGQRDAESAAPFSLRKPKREIAPSS